MSDKQRADHAQAKFWGAPISRIEAQKVFDQYGGVMTSQATAIQKLDAVISCLAEKAGVTTEVVNEWIKGKMAEAAKKATEVPPVEAPALDKGSEAQNAGDDKQQEGSSIILAP